MSLSEASPESSGATDHLPRHWPFPSRQIKGNDGNLLLTAEDLEDRNAVMVLVTTENVEWRRE